MYEWTAYACQDGPGGSLPACSDLQEVYHTAHAADAQRIVEDGRIKAGLVYDESRLRETRISVCWLSANTWSLGSIYGNVQFTFPWESLISGRYIYWVEAMRSYRPHAYRYLMTKQDRRCLDARLLPYDPVADNGPLRWKDGKWLWNPVHTSEFMFDTDISLEHCTEIKFIEHNRSICRPRGRACVDMNRHWPDVGSEFISLILGRSIHAADHALQLDQTGFLILSFLQSQLISGKTLNGPVTNQASSEALLKGALSLYAGGDRTSARSIVQLLASNQLLTDTLDRILKRHSSVTV